MEAFELVTDDEIRAAMTFAFERLKIVLEPSGASALAALLAGRVQGCRSASEWCCPAGTWAWTASLELLGTS